MPFMYCDAPKAIVQIVSTSFGTRSAPNVGHGLMVKLKGGMLFSLTDTVNNGQEWLFAGNLRKSDHIQVCFGPTMDLGGADRYAIAGDVESGKFAYGLTIPHK